VLDYGGVDADPDRFSIGGASFFPKEIPGGLAWPHDFSVDPQGNVYVNDGRNWTVDKFVPKKNADKKRLMTPIQPFK
jgi:hypothetical protein